MLRKLLIYPPQNHYNKIMLLRNGSIKMGGRIFQEVYYVS